MSKIPPVKQINPEPKKLSHFERPVAYIPGETNVQSFLDPETKSCIYSGQTLQELEEKYPGIKVYDNLDAVMPEITKAQDAKYITEFTEITREQWWEMYECLPPYQIRQMEDEGFFGFLCSEFWTSNITGHYYRLNDRYFSAHRRTTEKGTDHYQEIYKKFFIKNQE